MRRHGIHALGLDGRMPHERVSPEEELADYMTTGAMDSGSYFTDLLHNYVEESQDFAPVIDTSTEHAPAANKGSQGITKNFRDEDKLLVSAWLNVSMDPIQGVDQSQQSYWSRIHDYFHHHKTFSSHRTQGSLMKHWSAILYDVNVFCGCVTRIEDRNHSGWSVDDKIAHACALFKVEDKKKRKFALMHCWRILKDKPKWLARHKALGEAKASSNKKPKRTANSSPSSDAPSPTPNNGGVDAAVPEEVSGRPD